MGSFMSHKNKQRVVINYITTLRGGSSWQAAVKIGVGSIRGAKVSTNAF